MLSDLDSSEDIARSADKLLKEAGAYYKFPTPVDNLVAAARLSEPKHSLLSKLVLDQAPMHLRAVILPLRLKVRGLLDRRERELHVDPSIENEGKRRFVKLHEVGHDILPWQRELAYGDDDATLSWSIERRFELEASQTAAELGFQRRVFMEVAGSFPVGLKSVVDLSEMFGFSIQATFRRYVEDHQLPVAGLVLDRSPERREPLAYRRHEALFSESWGARFGRPIWPGLLHVARFPFIAFAAIAKQSVGGGASQTWWPDVAGDPLAVALEVFDNGYNILLLMWLPRVRRRRATPRSLMRVLAGGAESPS